MKHPLNITINVLTSLFFLVSGTIQAAQAEEIWLDFSVPEADVVLSAPTVASPRQSVLKKAIATKQSIQASENAAKLITLDFSVPKVDAVPATVASEFSQDEVKPLPTAKPSFRPPKSPAIKTPTSKPRSGKTRRQQVTALRRAIIGQESAGNFWIVNPDSGALGYGQLLRGNVRSWTKAALGQALTPEEFLANPDAQIRTIDHKLNEYLQRELAYTGGKNQQLAIRRVASRWYSGNPNLWNNTRPQYSNGRRYPSIASYTRSVWRRYLREIG